MSMKFIQIRFKKLFTLISKAKLLHIEKKKQAKELILIIMPSRMLKEKIC